MDCKLKLDLLIFDSVIFNRLGQKNDNELEISIAVVIGTNAANKSSKKVSVKITGEKNEEYKFEVQASGFFTIEGDTDEDLIKQNAVAIVMPYIRSEVSLLTAQPEVDTVVLPPFNIVEMMNES